MSIEGIKVINLDHMALSAEDLAATEGCPDSLITKERAVEKPDTPVVCTGCKEANFKAFYSAKNDVISIQGSCSRL